jgi:hypothetical protein
MANRRLLLRNAPASFAEMLSVRRQQAASGVRLKTAAEIDPRTVLRKTAAARIVDRIVRKIVATTTVA